MTVTAAQLAQLRRLVAEPTTTTYNDATLTAYMENHKLLDENGEEPYYLDDSTEPPTRTANDNWIETYDMNAAAADVWDEKLSTLMGSADKMDFSSDGSSFRQSQVVDQYKERVRYFRSRSSSKTATLHKWPEETNAEDFPWIVNLPEPDDLP